MRQGHGAQTRTAPLPSQADESSIPPKGIFRKPGTLHLHVDSRDKALTSELLRTFQKDYRLQAKANTMLASVRGSQFDTQQITAESHTPPGDREERFLSV